LGKGAPKQKRGLFQLAGQRGCRRQSKPPPFPTGPGGYHFSWGGATQKVTVFCEPNLVFLCLLNPSVGPKKPKGNQGENSFLN